MNKTQLRNKKVRDFLEKLYNQAIDETVSFNNSQYSKSVDSLFTTTSWGYREIILVVIVGMHLDPSYRASTQLYSCNPRAIFETPIKEFFIEKNIPHRKSGPLNIAKATKGLNSEWASQRDSVEIANEVISIVSLLEKNPTDAMLQRVGTYLLKKLIKESKTVQNLNVHIEPNENPEWLYHLCSSLIIQTPDAGNTPQKIAALLLKNFHISMNTGVIVTGENDRASVTSTTSKKPGDVNEESIDGEIYKVYEITVKPFDISRIRDSYDCIKTYNDSNKKNISEVIVICRPKDCPSDIQSSELNLYMGKYEYQNVTYYYWNIFEWVSYMLQRMTSKSKSDFYKELNSYISDVNTSAKVKTLWNELHS